MFLKYRYALGYERLCTLVGDSLSWRRFCRIGLEVSVPDESTIRKITRRCGPELVDALNRQLLAVAGEHGDTDLGRVRADTTVVEADIKYPTDSGLLTAATCRIAVRMRRLTNVGVRVIDQARTRVGGGQPHGAIRLVSLHEPDARPIRKGRLGKPVEFGYRAQVIENPDGIILDHSVHIGNPSDTDLLRPPSTGSPTSSTRHR